MENYHALNYNALLGNNKTLMRIETSFVKDI